MNSSPILVGEHGIVQVHFGKAGDGAQHHIFDARLRGGGDRDRVAIAAQPGGDPEDVDFGTGEGLWVLAAVRNRICCHAGCLLSADEHGRLCAPSTVPRHKA